jgi:2-polyprenyl-6-methoxyphenol hydroxylase-like FAD-dependent oxidoreductase
MAIAGSRVAVIGGSIAGCAAAIALTRAGCDVTVFERTSGSLRDRGFGIGLPPDTLSQMVAADYVDASIPAIRATTRLFVIRGDRPAGRVLWWQPFPAQATAWSVVWQDLRRRVPDHAYRAGVGAAVADADPTGQTVATDQGEQRFDLVVGADGYASGVRQRVAPGSSVQLPGYCLWRGTCPVSLLPDAVPRALDGTASSVCFPSGHCMLYLIPDHQDTTRQLVNWGLYFAPPQLVTETRGFPPGQVPSAMLDVLDRVVSMHFPPLWADVVRQTPRMRISVLPIFDALASRYVSGQLVLVGDAGATARPHAGSGAMKAVQDAMALGSACAAAEWEPALAAYNRDRLAAGTAVVRLGRSLGRAQVEHTPRWGRMSEPDFLTWWRSAASGRASLYE